MFQIICLLEPILLTNYLFANSISNIGYVDPVNPTKLFETAVSAMLKVLYYRSVFVQ
jgi:hypothetical protein